MREFQETVSGQGVSRRKLRAREKSPERAKRLTMKLERKAWRVKPDLMKRA